MPSQASFMHAQTCVCEGLPTVGIILIAAGIHDAHSKLHEHHALQQPDHSRPIFPHHANPTMHMPCKECKWQLGRLVNLKDQETLQDFGR